MPSNNRIQTASLTDRTFGCEIEFVFGRNRRLSSREVEARLEAALPGRITGGVGYTHRVTSGWKVVTDASVSGGFEVVSPILSGIEGLREVVAIMDALSAFATVDRSTGFHVHVGGADVYASPTALGRLIRFYENAERNYGLLGVLAPSRRGNANWCAFQDSGVVALAARGDVALSSLLRTTGNRYVGLNMYQRCQTYGTVEFRRHQGTLDGAKAVAWIIACVRTIDSLFDSEETASRSGSATASAKKKFENYTTRIGLRAYARSRYTSVDPLVAWAGSYLEARRAHFAGETVPRVRGNFRALLFADRSVAVAA